MRQTAINPKFAPALSIAKTIPLCHASLKKRAVLLLCAELKKAIVA